MSSTKTTKKPQVDPKLVKGSYTVLADGRVAGERKKKGDVIELTADQAKYENVASVSKKG
ncbi:hypothetical protein [Thioclava sp.]|uniref:hypothetical protein n=1 Tax=Thioclava sp. TaxID=1933450 RepID=UPI0032421683